MVIKKILTFKINLTMRLINKDIIMIKYIDKVK